MTAFTRAIVRPPGANFAQGLTSVDLGKPDLSLALEQHARYCAALEQCGLMLTHLPADARFPDSTFVEDTAIVTDRCAILTRPGAASRTGEVAAIEPVLRGEFERTHAIVAPGTVDGGDICQVENHFFIGISERTNAEGARQLAAILAQEGFTSRTVDIRGVNGILHLKSGISYLGDKRLVLIDALAGHAAFSDFTIVRIAATESYAANFLRINESVILSAGFPQFESRVRAFGYPVVALDMSEFRKMDGALSCLSLRF
ncbi:MAG: N(G),N(G)-dimethylarginine dimethylaminohydrolase [Xanthomonadales bacterium PRO7]|nr:N(G),N(G)-dimethylarginine dimethylaminohydrolase [Xanthomonadales bacterium PRO7]